MGIVKLSITGYICERCHHEWIPRSKEKHKALTEELPTICPKCKSPYWNKPKKKK